MEIKIEKAVNIEVDNTLGYPLVFVGVEYCSKEYLQELKAKFFNYTLSLLDKKSCGSYDVNSERGIMALKECAVIAKRLDLSYICYPAGNLIWIDSLRCGPEYITPIISTLLDTDPDTGNRIYDLFLSIRDAVAALLGGGKEATKTGETAKSEPAPTKKPRKYEYFEICNFVKKCAFRQIGDVIYGIHFHGNGSDLIDWPMRSGRILMNPPIDDLSCGCGSSTTRKVEQSNTQKKQAGDRSWPASFPQN